MRKLLPGRHLLKKAGLALFMVAALHLGVNAQVSFSGVPATTLYQLDSESLPVHEVIMPYNVQILKANDQINNEQLGQPLKIAEALPVSLDLATQGEWTELASGEYVCRMRVRSEGALAMVFSYSDFFIPAGTSLYIYNTNKTHVLGAYTSKSHPQGGLFSTEMLAGDDAIFEFVTPSKEILPRVTIDMLGYCYNGISVKHHLPEAASGMSTEASYGSSGSCEVNINCPEGADWQDEKRGVVHMLMYISGLGGWYVCTGTLINNTKQDLTPYVLSAFHCYNGANATNDLPRWVFYFHYESPTCNNQYPVGNYTLTGCTLRVTTPINGASDGLLIELTNEIPEDWDVYFNGWDRRNAVVPGRGVGIHHPAGDIKKISSFDTYSSDTWTSGNIGATNAHWNIKFVQTETNWGVTEGGSSGSPIFSNEHYVIGTLTGGGSSCSSQTSPDYYGKLWYHWDQHGTTPATQMKTWLDPLDLGVETLAGTSYSATSPRLIVDYEDLVFYSNEINVPGDIQNITITGYNLEGTISLVSDACFPLSLDGETWSESIELPGEGGEFYVCYIPTVIGYNTGMITIANGSLRNDIYINLTASSCPAFEMEQLLTPKGDIDVPYTFAFNVTGGVAPYTYTIVSGRLPRGVEMSEDGVISGTPLDGGNYNFAFTVTDANGCKGTYMSSVYIVCQIINTYPFQESFDTQDVFGACWSQEYLKGEQDWIVQHYVSGSYYQAKSDPNYAYFSKEGTDDETTMLVTPQMDLTTISSPYLSFWNVQRNKSGIQDVLNVYYKNSADADWTLLTSFTASQMVWKQTDMPLPNPSNEYFIGFEAVGKGGRGVAVDDISVYSLNGDTSIKDYFTSASIECDNVIEDFLNMKWNVDVESVMIYTPTGELMVSDSSLLGTQELSIPTANWAKGVYIVKLRYQFATHIVKVVKK